MLTGIKLRAHPTEEQKLILNQWMGCARVIWNSKCTEEKYYNQFARKYCPIGTYAPIDQTTAQFKDNELTPWLKSCPSQILRNSAVNWYGTYQKYMQRICGKPKQKKKSSYSSIHLTNEIFEFKHCEDGVIRLFVGSKKNNIGFLSFKTHKRFNLPNSIYIINDCGRYYISFCYETDKKAERKGQVKVRAKKVKVDEQEILDLLSGCDEEWLNDNVTGIDRGVTIPVHTGLIAYDYEQSVKEKQLKSERYIKRYQRRMARQIKGNARRNKTKNKLNNEYRKVKNRRKDYCHKTSRKIVDAGRVFIFEDLKIKNMTKKAKPKKDLNGQYQRNNKQAKSGLNRAILNVGWSMLYSFVKYKSKAEGKACFKINASYTSQECSRCEHIDSDNRKSQSVFCCTECGYEANADANAALVIKKRGIKLLKDPGTGLTKNNVLFSSQDGALKQFLISPEKSKLNSGSGLPVKKESLVKAGSHLL